MKFIVIIPARFFSTRFPGKLLKIVDGKPMIICVMQAAINSGADRVIVATDSTKIVNVVQSEINLSYQGKGEVYLTKSTHRSGMERIAEIVSRYRFDKNQIIVHLQGDEPLITSKIIRHVANSCNMSITTSVATIATPLFSTKDIHDVNIVKVVINVYNHALYFSRAPIPWRKDLDNCTINNNKININHTSLRHIGIYSYRSEFLNRYIKWTRSILEQYEMLEQLRILWYGENIYVSVIYDIDHIISVDTPESLKRVNDILNNNNKK